MQAGTSYVRNAGRCGEAARLKRLCLEHNGPEWCASV